MSYVLLYIPICMITLLVIETCKHDDPKKIIKKSLKDFLILTLCFVIGALIIFYMNKYYPRIELLTLAVEAGAFLICLILHIDRSEWLKEGIKDFLIFTFCFLTGILIIFFINKYQPGDMMVVIAIAVEVAAIFLASHLIKKL